MKSWQKIASLGLVIGMAATACTISSGDPDNEGIGGANVGGTGGTTGGTSGTTGGSTADGGATTGGTTTEGGSSTGGSTSGGSAGSGTGGDGGAEEPSPCEACLIDICTDEYNACWDTTDTVDGEGNAGGNSLPDCIDEFVSYQSCLETAWDERSEIYNEADCDESAVLVDSAFPLAETNALISCMLDPELTGNDCIDVCADFSDFD